MGEASSLRTPGQTLGDQISAQGVKDGAICFDVALVSEERNLRDAADGGHIAARAGELEQLRTRAGLHIHLLRRLIDGLGVGGRAPVNQLAQGFPMIGELAEPGLHPVRPVDTPRSPIEGH